MEVADFEQAWDVPAEGTDMVNRRIGAAVLAAGLAMAGCATDKKVQASSEVIYEDPDAGSVAQVASSDPFEGCEAKHQPPAVVLACGSVIAAFVQLPQLLSAAQVQQNFQGFEGSFPAQSTRERFTQKFGEVEALGARVYENSPVAPFRSDMLIIPVGEGTTRILSCRVTGSVDWTRCGKIAAELAAEGVPQRFGAVAPVANTVASDGGMAPPPEHPDGHPQSTSTDASNGTTTLPGPR